MQGPEYLSTSSNDIVTLDGVALGSGTTVINLSVIFDQDLAFNSHIKQISILDQTDTKNVLHTFQNAAVCIGWNEIKRSHFYFSFATLWLCELYNRVLT